MSQVGTEVELLLLPGVRAEIGGVVCDMLCLSEKRGWRRGVEGDLCVRAHT